MLSAGFDDACEFIARNHAVSYVDPRFRSRIRRERGHTAIFAWSDLILDRSRKLVGLQLPAACATPILTSRIYEFLHAQSPDTARSWRANRDVNVKR